jgi:elongation factor G
VKVYAPEKIRNVALVGHGGAGKTTLAEALLYRAGTVSRLGRVEDGNTVTDFDPEEHERGHSVSLALAPIEWNGYKINIIDTPGYADFVADVYGALHVADLAVFVVSAVDGVEVGTERAWRIAEDLGVPRMVFINKLDKEEASFDRTLEALQERFGAGVAPIELPIGENEAFRGVADLFTNKAYVYDSGSAQETEIPAELEEREHEVHDALVEGIVVADDDLLEPSHYISPAVREGFEEGILERVRTRPHWIVPGLGVNYSPELFELARRFNKDGAHWRHVKRLRSSHRRPMGES